jgi:squalene-hopene/tetraprenyl-beta-curcumene cyclase
VSATIRGSAGPNVAQEEPHLQHALAWLRKNQDGALGLWPAASLNKKRDPASDAGRFMSDAATAYSILALTGGKSAVTQI